MNRRYFIGHDGIKMHNNEPFDFSLNFDCIVTRNFIYLKKNNPKTFYIKTDYLPIFVEKILSNIKNNFIVITGCSDYSPVINFNYYYNIIINHPQLICWWSENALSDHPKYKSLPVGIASGTIQHDQRLYRLSQDNALYDNTRKNKILCVWNFLDFNVCGEEYIQRPQCTEFVKKYPGIFDYFDYLSLDDYIELIKQYVFIFCPNGNGVDPCPKLLDALCCKTIPILISNRNNKSLYQQMHFPCLFINQKEEMIEKDFLQKKVDLKTNYSQTIKRFSAQYWADLINSF